MSGLSTRISVMQSTSKLAMAANQIYTYTKKILGENSTDDKNDANDESSDDKNNIPIIEPKAKDDMLLIDQIWLRTFVNDNGYFTLENQESGAVLTASSCPKKYKNSELEGLHWVSTTLFTLQR